MKWYEKARVIAKIRGIKQLEFEDVLEVGRGGVSHYFSGRTDPSPQQMKAIADKLKISLDDLLSENVSAEQCIDNKKKNNGTIEYLENGYVSLRIVKLGEICNYLSNSTVAGDMYMKSPVKCSESSFIVKITDDSTTSNNPARSYPPGTMLFVDPELRPKNGSIVIAATKDTGVEFVRIYRVEPTSTSLLAINPSYESIKYDETAITILGVVFFTGTSIIDE